MIQALGIWLSFFLVAGCSGCNKQLGNDSMAPIGSPADLSTYTQKLNSDLIKIGKAPINFNNIKFYSWSTEAQGIEGIGGRCSIDSNGSKSISVVKATSEFSWFTYYDFIHEVGHCVYNKSHIDGKVSFMNTKQNMVLYEQFRNEGTRLKYLKEMIEN